MYTLKGPNTSPQDVHSRRQNYLLKWSCQLQLIINQVGHTLDDLTNCNKKLKEMWNAQRPSWSNKLNTWKKMEAAFTKYQLATEQDACECEKGCVCVHKTYEFNETTIDREGQQTLEDARIVLNKMKIMLAVQ